MNKEYYNETMRIIESMKERIKVVERLMIPFDKSTIALRLSMGHVFEDYVI